MTVKELSQVSSLSGGALALVRDDSTPPLYLASLEKQGLYQDAVRFLAHKLPPDAGIKWANRCLREFAAPDQKDRKDAALEASENWVKTPGDAARFAAKDATDKPDVGGGATLVAMAVYMSGGSLTPPGSPEVQPPPYSAQKMIAGSVMVAVLGHEPQNANQRYQKALAIGKEFDTNAP